ncbi:hypothetical protein [Streptomyces sp. NPDC003697]
MNLTLKRLLGATAAAVTGATALLGIGTVSTAEAGRTGAVGTATAKGSGSVGTAEATGSVGTAEAVGTTGVAAGAHCDRAERGVWGSGGPSRNLTGHRCSLPSDKRRWHTVRIDDLVLTHYRTEYADGGVDRTETLHNRVIRCLGYTLGEDSVNWFGCPPD